MGFTFLGFYNSIFILSLFFIPSICQQPNTDGYFVSIFLQKMGLTSSRGYNFSSSVCSWQGVFCDSSQTYVLGLKVSGLGLSGLIPDNSIGKLSKLQTLDLSNNKITNLPSDFWSLGSLKTLNLSFNHFSGLLPSNIGNFGQLEVLDFSNNNFSGSIPEAVSSLTSLQILKLDLNGFESRIPSGLMNCHSLVSIDLSSNRLTGFLAKGFLSAFPKLRSLNLAGNEIQGQDSDFSEMISISYLNLSRNLFQGSVVSVLQAPLEVVDLSRNQFQGHISQVNLKSTFNWSNLVHLDLSENQLSGEIFSKFNETRNLKHLNLAFNRFNSQRFPNITMLLGLEYLNLSGDNLIGRIPVETSTMRSLEILDLSRNRLNNRLPSLGMKGLRILDVSYNNMTGEIPMVILQRLLSGMEKFNFSYNNFTLCTSGFPAETLKSAFVGSLDSCPIAADPEKIRRKSNQHKGLTLAFVTITIAVVFCLLVALLFLAFGYRRKRRTWIVKHDSSSYKEETNISGPFSFQTDSTTWVADVKLATSVPVVIFEKPLLNFTFADLLSATSNFERGTLLAEGRFGPVYRGFLPGGIHVAVKVLVHGSTMTDQEAARELEYLGRIKHPNLVPLTGYCLAGDQRIAIYDYMENGNLQNLLHDLPLGVQMNGDWSRDIWDEDDNDDNGIQNVGSEGLLTTWRFRHKVALGTARALAFLHHGCSPPIIHRDVKASSVYLDSNLEPRLSDFGLSKIFGNDIEDEIARGCPGYVAPEFVQPESNPPKNLTPKSDVYGFGVILFELITGKKPVEDEYPDYSDEDGKEGNLVNWVRGLVRRNQGLRSIDPKIVGTGRDFHLEEALKIGYLCTADLPFKRPSMQQVVGLLKDIDPLRNL
ncbi:probable LRR receptor-like serine/threonine-protein kinase At2g24230 [Impatiens glandulifera]|uniref:probable LRR receptor-like serine/threonine-protein kinase At2g24230 n=1 Tax=Impatiens glandulifera TaxID=253017 RepID=UPI001FB0BA4D|nr:probable LRR receptor-like serine/threonine-protein kinase At2g24230 [Impatiens glandulifera]